MKIKFFITVCAVCNLLVSAINTSSVFFSASRSSHFFPATQGHSESIVSQDGPPGTVPYAKDTTLLPSVVHVQYHCTVTQFIIQSDRKPTRGRKDRMRFFHPQRYFAYAPLSALTHHPSIGTRYHTSKLLPLEARNEKVRNAATETSFQHLG